MCKEMAAFSGRSVLELWFKRRTRRRMLSGPHVYNCMCTIRRTLAQVSLALYLITQEQRVLSRWQYFSALSKTYDNTCEWTSLLSVWFVLSFAMFKLLFLLAANQHQHISVWIRRWRCLRSVSAQTSEKRNWQRSLLRPNLATSTTWQVSETSRHLPSRSRAAPAKVTGWRLV